MGNAVDTYFELKWNFTLRSLDMLSLTKDEVYCTLMFFVMKIVAEFLRLQTIS